MAAIVKRYATSRFSITEKDDSTIISFIKKGNTLGEVNSASNAHYAKMRELYPEIEHPHLARYLRGCTAKTTRYEIKKTGMIREVL